MSPDGVLENLPNDAADARIVVLLHPDAHQERPAHPILPISCRPRCELGLATLRPSHRTCFATSAKRRQRGTMAVRSHLGLTPRQQS